MECGASYRTDGPEHLRPVGETEFVAAIAGGQRGRRRRHHRRHRRPRRPHAAPRPARRGPRRPRGRGRRSVPGHPGRPGRGAARRAAHDRRPGHTGEGPRPRLPTGRRPPRRAGPHLRHLAVPHPDRRPARPGPGRARAPRSCSTTSPPRSASDPGPAATTRSSRRGSRPWPSVAACPNVVAKLGGLAMPDNGFWPVGPRRPTRRGRVPGEAGALVPPRPRLLRPRTGDVRVELPGRQALRRLPGGVGGLRPHRRRASTTPSRTPCSPAPPAASTASDRPGPTGCASTP